MQTRVRSSWLIEGYISNHVTCLLPLGFIVVGRAVVVGGKVVGEHSSGSM